MNKIEFANVVPDEYIYVKELGKIQKVDVKDLEEYVIYTSEGYKCTLSEMETVGYYDVFINGRRTMLESQIVIIDNMIDNLLDVKDTTKLKHSMAELQMLKKRTEEELTKWQTEMTQDK